MFLFVFAVEVVIAPPFPLIIESKNRFRHVQIAAQNCHQESCGAFTGEVSAELLGSLSVDYVILGHSERRSMFNESNELVAAKIKRAQDSGLKVIACIGETLNDREEGLVESVLSTQLTAINRTDVCYDRMVIAYEPVWAIGTGKVATPQEAQETHKFIRSWLLENVSKETAESVRIIYGGSVNSKNCGELIAERDIDGFLVGGASLKKEFALIVDSASRKN